MGGVKEKLYNYFNQNYQNMFNRFIVTSEDEMVKKVRNFVDKEEMKTLARYTPKEIAAAARPGRRHGQVQHRARSRNRSSTCTATSRATSSAA